jgi:hypothetical protein
MRDGAGGFCTAAGEKNEASRCEENQNLSNK